MDPIQFCYWLQGAMELLPAGQSLSVDQVNVIKDHLKLVFNKITPDRPVAPNLSKSFEEMLEEAKKKGTVRPGVQWPDNPSTTFCCQASPQKDVVRPTAVEMLQVMLTDTPEPAVTDKSLKPKEGATAISAAALIKKLGNILNNSLVCRRGGDISIRTASADKLHDLLEHVESMGSLIDD